MHRRRNRYGLLLASWRDVIPKEGKDTLFSVYAVRRREEAGACVEEPALVIRGRDDRFTGAFDAIRRAMGSPVARP